MPTPSRPLALSLLLVLAALLAACGEQQQAPASAAAPSPAPATTPVAEPPPESAAPTLESLLKRKDTLASAQARLGAENVVAQTLTGAEGETASGWVLFPSDPTRKIEVWLDDGGEHPDTLVVGQGATGWTRADGVRVGMSSAELEELNGLAYAFYGFEWDYGGTVTDWRAGSLYVGGAAQGSVTLCPPADAPNNYPSGDTEFMSDDARLKANPAVVCEFTVVLPLRNN